MGNNFSHQSKLMGRRNHLMLRQVSGGGFANTGVSKNAVRASAADDEIAEALAERAEKRRQRRGI